MIGVLLVVMGVTYLFYTEPEDAPLICTCRADSLRW